MVKSIILESNNAKMYRSFAYMNESDLFQLNIYENLLKRTNMTSTGIGDAIFEEIVGKNTKKYT